MNKIPTVFLRNPQDMRHLTEEVNPEAAWVLAGEGVPTRKYDGTCVMMDEDGLWWARREVKPGKLEPDNWVMVEMDAVTGKCVGWEPIEQSPFYKFWKEAVDQAGWVVDQAGWVAVSRITPGTYELCGPKINGNPEKLEQHSLFKHSEVEILKWTHEGNDINTYHHIIQYLAEEHGWEGIVWHHPDGRMAKLKAKDFK